MTDLMLECVDLRAVFVERFTLEGVSEESARCLVDGFDEEFIRGLAKTELSGSDADPTEDPVQEEKFSNLVMDCLSFEEISNLRG